MAIGKFLEKNFKNKEVEVLIDHDAEWVQYAESTRINGMVLHATFIAYDAECKVITFANLHNGEKFYVSEHVIQMFWEPGINVIESVKSMINSGTKLYKANKRG